MKPLQSSPVTGGKLYFAYGTDLHVAQMAQKCPNSEFWGKGILQGYEWQISQNGVANIVKAKDSCVEGLVYHITAEDEKSLNPFKESSKAVYQKSTLRIEFEKHGLYCGVKSTLLPNLGEVTHDKTHPLNEWRPPSHPETVEALVYLCHDHGADKKPGKEYTAQMDQALIDAAALGVSEGYIKEYIAPHFKKASCDNRASVVMQKTVDGFKNLANDLGLGKGYKE